MRVDQKYTSFDEKRKFTGHEYDSATALSYMKARYYDGGRGQFLSQDPVFWGVMNLANPQSLNSYSYALNNPIVFVDPTGESPEDILAGLSNAYLTNLSYGQGRISPDQYTGDQRDYLYGQTLGDLAAYLTGIAQIYLGTTIGAGGTTLTVGSGGLASALSIPAAVGGAAIAANGVNTAAVSAYNFAESSRKVSQVLQNKQRGDAFRDSTAEEFERQGRVIKKEVVKDTPFGKRIIDFEVQDKSGNILGGVETKTGSSRYTPSQRAKDAYLRATGYIVNVMRKVF